MGLISNDNDMIKTPERTDASHRLGVEAEHGDLYDLREEIEVGDGEDVRLDGGVGGHHEMARGSRLGHASPCSHGR